MKRKAVVAKVAFEDGRNSFVEYAKIRRGHHTMEYSISNKEGKKDWNIVGNTSRMGSSRTMFDRWKADSEMSIILE